MKRKFNLFLGTSLLASSMLTTLTSVISPNEINSKTIISSNIDNETATKYANKTSIISKALLIGENQGFNTNDLLNNMYNQNQSSDINNLTGGNTGNDFIKNWTTNLDGNSINAIQPLFQRHGTNQDSINKITTDMNSYQSYNTYLPTVKNNLNNILLSQDSSVSLFVDGLKFAKEKIPDFDNYLSYANYLPVVTTVVQELVNDWDQPKDFSGANLLAKMKDYMSKKGEYAQAWQKLKGYDNWHYVESRAGNWNWTQFYEYMAGVNFNYVFKLISGKYIGDMITDNVHWAVSFDSATFLKTFSDAISKIINTPAAFPYLIKALVPIIKEKVLKLEAPTLGIKTVTWKDNNATKSVVIKKVLLELQHLLSPAGHNNLVSLISSLFSAPFSEDIIINASGFLYTLPEIFSTIPSLFISVNDIATKVADSLTDILKSIPIDDYINKVITFTNKYLTTNPDIDLEDFSKYFNLTIGNKDFSTALLDIKDIIDNPNSSVHNAKEVLEILGVQFNGKTNFKTGSVFDSLSTWLNIPNSSINQLLNIIQDNNYPGIIDNMIKEQQDLYQDKYAKYFDMSSKTYFIITDVKMNKYQDDDGTISAVLSYKMLDKLNSNSYQIAFINDDFINTKDFKLNLFHQI